MRNILVTGAYGGMGRALLDACRGRDVRVFALDRAVGEPEDNIVPIAAELTSEESVRAAFGEVSQRTERLDAIVHFAGVYQLDSLVEMPSEDFDRMFAEMRAETIPFRACGREYRIPGELPAAVVLELARHADEESLPPKLVLRCAEAIFGRTTLDELCAQPDFTLPKLEKLLEWAFSTVGGPGEGPAPGKA